MESEKNWGSELEDLSVGNWDFLSNDAFCKIIAMRGSVSNIQNASEEFKSFLATYKPSSILGESEGKISFNSIVCGHQLTLIKESFKGCEINSVIEAGAGLGNLSRIFRMYSDKLDYTIYDLPVMQKFSEKFLKAHGLTQTYINPERNVFNRYKFSGLKFDLFISNICLSELPALERDKLLYCILPKCKYAFIIDGDKNKGFDSILAGFMVDNFNEVHIVPYVKGMWEGQRVYVGKKL